VVDITFDVYSDTPIGKDPDSHSPTLREYHQILWSKTLPSGDRFDLDDRTPRLLHHNSHLGEFFLSSDAITHTYKNTKKMAQIVGEVPSDELDTFFSISSTIGAYIVFPSRRIKNKMTINGARGVNHKIQDRFDLTLECIRYFYKDEVSPLSDPLQRYATFFHLFQDFRGYVDFFLLQDLVEEDYSSVRFFLPFSGFDQPPLPSTVDEYMIYKDNIMNFVAARNQRIRKLFDIQQQVDDLHDTFRKAEDNFRTLIRRLRRYIDDSDTMLGVPVKPSPSGSDSGNQEADLPNNDHSDDFE